MGGVVVVGLLRLSLVGEGVGRSGGRGRQQATTSQVGLIRDAAGVATPPTPISPATRVRSRRAAPTLPARPPTQGTVRPDPGWWKLAGQAVLLRTSQLAYQREPNRILRADPGSVRFDCLGQGWWRSPVGTCQAMRF
jgi:hypothetical protein